MTDEPLTPSQIGAALGKLGRGKPKRFTPAEIKRRTAQLVAGRRAQAAKQRAEREKREKVGG